MKQNKQIKKAKNNNCSVPYSVSPARIPESIVILVTHRGVFGD